MLECSERLQVSLFTRLCFYVVCLLVYGSRDAVEEAQLELGNEGLISVHHLAGRLSEGLLLCVVT